MLYVRPAGAIALGKAFGLGGEAIRGRRDAGLSWVKRFQREREANVAGSMGLKEFFPESQYCMSASVPLSSGSIAYTSDTAMSQETFMKF